MSDGDQEIGPREDAPPFTPEQIQWIDRLIVGRFPPTSGPGDPAGSSGASGSLTTAASQPGKSSMRVG